MSPPKRRGPAGPLSKIAQHEVGDRAVAKAPAPASAFTSDRSKYSTFVTKPPEIGGQPVTIYSADRLWADVTLVLETAGPVAVGDAPNLGPVTSGKGILLPTGVPLTFRCAKATKLYVLSTAVNRIKVMVQPVPWQEQITGLLRELPPKIADALRRRA